MLIRLQKRIADLGYCSRRKAEELMLQGKVKVNGKVAKTLGTKVSEEDEITVQGKTLKQQEKVSLMLHKEAGVLSSRSDPNHQKTILSKLPKKFSHLKPAGRLDKESEGLIILSSDGAFIQKLTHPKHEHSKTYEVLVKDLVKPESLQALASGTLKLEGYTLNPMKAEILKKTKDRKTWLKIILTEGRNRQIRKVMDSLGHPVVYLKRIAIGNLALGDLKKGDFKILSPEECSKALSPSS